VTPLLLPSSNSNSPGRTQGSGHGNLTGRKGVPVQHARGVRIVAASSAAHDAAEDQGVVAAATLPCAMRIRAVRAMAYYGLHAILAGLLKGNIIMRPRVSLEVLKVGGLARCCLRATRREVTR
jgi:hypothetical protein